MGQLYWPALNEDFAIIDIQDPPNVAQGISQRNWNADITYAK